MTDVARVIRNGKTAVIVSPGHGGGWSTWVHDDNYAFAESEVAAAAVFDPDVVAWVEDGKPADDRLAAFEGRYGYIGGLGDVVIEWIPVGTRFFVDEYDGHESIEIIGPDYGFVS